MKKKQIIIASIFGAVVIGLIAFKKIKGDDLLEVYEGKIEERTIISTVTANGKIRPEAEVKISPDVSGEITHLYVQEGDTVKEGQLLLKINPDLYLTSRDRARASLSSSQSTYESTSAQLTQAKARFAEQEANYNRSKQLFEEGVLSQSEFDAATAAYAVAKSEVRASEQRLASARYGIDNSRATLSEANKNLGRTSIYAPTDGVISALNNEKGERVVGTAQMAGTEIMVISNFNNMEVNVDVNENDILEIKKGDTAVIEVDAYSDREFKGVVTEIAKSASNLSGMQMSSDQVTNFEVKIRMLKTSYDDLLEVNDQPFLPGMSASVEIQTDLKTGIPCLPIEAVNTRERKDSASQSSEIELDEVIFSVDKSDKVQKHIIQTGIQDSRYIEILQGADSLVNVIVGPYEAVSKKLKDGMMVKVVKKETDDTLE